jgi:hypothetical protein
MKYADYRPFVPNKEQSRILGKTAEKHTAARMDTERAQKIFTEWNALYNTPFKGVTVDGHRQKGLFRLKNADAPTQAMCEAAWGLLNNITPEQRRRSHHPVGSPLWRKWQNSEMYVEDYGLRLESASADTRSRVLNVLAASLSEQGYATSLGVMQLNAFLGQVLDAPGVLNEWSYSFVLFGVPSLTEPWGWQMYGHHLVLNCMVIGGQMTLTPCFLGAEIVYADQGPFEGLAMFKDHERIGLEFMNSLPGKSQEQAIVGKSMLGEDLPPGRRHLADYFNLGGAYQDNRIVPYEGLPLGSLESDQRNLLLDLVNEYIAPLPDGPRQARMEEFERHEQDTHFCWIGGTGSNDPFYYRIQSPVVFIEFDHHPGMFLTNEMPLKYHIHTIVRTPNGNDYGIDLLRQHYKSAHKHDHSHSHDHDHDHDH